MVAGIDMIAAIWLLGFEHQSIWGYVEGSDSFFAQVWTTPTKARIPTCGSPHQPGNSTTPKTLVAPIVEHTGAEPGRRCDHHP